MWEEKESLKFSEALNGRVFAYDKDESISKIEFDILNQVFEKDEKFTKKFNQPKNIKVVDRNTFYDSFSFDQENKKYLIKFGDNLDEELFSREEFFL